MFENINAFAESLRKQYGSSLLTKEQAAKELSISRATIDRMRQEGKIKSQTIGGSTGRVRFSVVEVARIIMGK